MGALTRWLALAALIAATPAHAEPLDRFAPFITEAAQRFGVPAEWIVRVMRAESGGRTTLDGRPITSSKGAMGLMQIMPRTWAELRAALGLGRDPYDPRDNILAGTYYLRVLHDRFGYPGLFAAYNAGPARYADVLAGRASLPAETRGYLAATAGNAPSSPPRGVAATSQSAPPPSLFFVRAAPLAARPVEASTPSTAAPAPGFFVTLSTSADR